MLPLGTLGIAFLLFAAVTACSAEDAGAQGWTASATLVKELTERQSNTLYEEEKVPNYVLPDPLAMLDGTRVSDAETWRTKRRPEILELFREHVYGRAPVGRPQGMTFAAFDVEPNALDGKATRKQVRVNFTGKSDGPGMDLLLYLPNGAKRPVPTFVLLNFGGNHTVCADPAIRLTASWTRDDKTDHHATDAQRGSAASSFPLHTILARGYAVATWQTTEGLGDAQHNPGARVRRRNRLLRGHRSRLRRRLQERRPPRVRQAGRQARTGRLGLHRRVGVGTEPGAGLLRDRQGPRREAHRRARALPPREDRAVGRRGG
jgi:hypothetical protein